MAEGGRTSTIGASGTCYFSDGTVFDVPSVDGVVPYVSPPVLKPRSRFPFIASDSDEEQAEGNGATSANPALTKRPRGEPSAPPPQRRRAESEAGLREGGEAFRANCQIQKEAAGEFAHITEAGIAPARRYSLWGWPAYAEMFPAVNPPSRNRHRVFNAGNLRGLHQRHVIIRAKHLDRTSAAPSPAGAAQVDAHELRPTDGNGDLECPQE